MLLWNNHDRRQKEGRDMFALGLEYAELMLYMAVCSTCDFKAALVLCC